MPLLKLHFEHGKDDDNKGKERQRRRELQIRENDKRQNKLLRKKLKTTVVKETEAEQQNF